MNFFIIFKFLEMYLYIYMFVDHLVRSHHEQMVINSRMGMGVGHQEPSQKKRCQNLINIQTTAYNRSNFIYMKGSKLKMYKRLELRMFWVHSNYVEPKVQHVLCHWYTSINIFIKIFNILIIFSYTGEPPSEGFPKNKKVGKGKKTVYFFYVVFVKEPPHLKKSRKYIL